MLVFACHLWFQTSVLASTWPPLVICLIYIYICIYIYIYTYIYIYIYIYIYVYIYIIARVLWRDKTNGMCTYMCGGGAVERSLF